LRGVGQGIVGIPVKPVAAVLDMAHKTTEGIRNTTTYFEREERVRTRKPRAFGIDGTVVVSY
jgi:vacuolar protein sorting-associated protein 13A/C